MDPFITASMLRLRSQGYTLKEVGEFWGYSGAAAWKAIVDAQKVNDVPVFTRGAMFKRSNPTSIIGAFSPGLGEVPRDKNIELQVEIQRISLAGWSAGWEK